MNRYTQAIRRLQALIQIAERQGVEHPTAAALATADARGRPSVRTVLLKVVDAQGVVFYTNLESRKARQLAVNPRAALCLAWEPMNEQVLIEGAVRPVSQREADAYWATRVRLSQLGAWASRQSKPMRRRTDLLVSVAGETVRFAGGSVSRPKHWSGYRVIPDRIEFWTRRGGRLHERVLYKKTAARWARSLLYP